MRKGRHYADDISVTVMARDLQRLREVLQEEHNHAMDFENAVGLQSNRKKCFTFGHNCVGDIILEIPVHKEQFRLGGGSLKTVSGASAGWADLELVRIASWEIAIGNIRKLPAAWRTKRIMMQRSMPRLTHAQGTHTLRMPTT